MVNRVLLGFEDCRRHFPKKQCEVTGTPIRRSLKGKIPQGKALASFGLLPGRTTVLVMGGSQGAHGINEVLRATSQKLTGEKIQILHLTGVQDEAAVKAAYNERSIPSHVVAFCHQMEVAYSAADVVIARSGAASLAEISNFALPSILIPYPHAADDHQRINAEIFARAGAATVIKEADINGEALARVILSMGANSGQLAIMGDRSHSLFPTDAASRVAAILESCQKK